MSENNLDSTGNDLKEDINYLSSVLTPGDIYFFSSNSYVLCVKRSSTPSILPKNWHYYKKPKNTKITFKQSKVKLNPNANAFQTKMHTNNNPTVLEGIQDSNTEEIKWETELIENNKILDAKAISEIQPGIITVENQIHISCPSIVNSIVDVAKSSNAKSDFTTDDHPLDKVLTRDDLLNKLQIQLEYYFRRENLSTDAYLLSQMDSDTYVLISTLAKFNQVRKLTHDMDLIVEALKKSTELQLDEKCERVRSVKNRCVVILREIDASTSADTVKSLFDFNKCPKFISCEHEHNNNWYVNFDSEEKAQQAYQYLRENVPFFNGKPLMARIKAKPTIMPRTFYHLPTSQSLTQSIVQLNTNPTTLNQQNCQTTNQTISNAQSQFYQHQTTLDSTQQQAGLYMAPVMLSSYLNQQNQQTITTPSTPKSAVPAFTAAQSNSFVPFFPYQPDPGTAFAIHGFTLSRQCNDDYSQHWCTSSRNSYNFNNNFRHQQSKYYSQRNNFTSSNRNSEILNSNNNYNRKHNNFSKINDTLPSNRFHPKTNNSDKNTSNSTYSSTSSQQFHNQNDHYKHYQSNNKFKGKQKNDQTANTVKDNQVEISQSRVNNQKKLKDVNFRLESTSFPPLPGSNDKVLENNSCKSNVKNISDVVKGTLLKTLINEDSEIEHKQKTFKPLQSKDSCEIKPTTCSQNKNQSFDEFKKMKDAPKDSTSQKKNKKKIAREEELEAKTEINSMSSTTNMSYAQVAQVFSSQLKQGSCSLEYIEKRENNNNEI